MSILSEKDLNLVEGAIAPNYQVLGSLAARWLEEHEHEDFAEYKKLILKMFTKEYTNISIAHTTRNFTVRFNHSKIPNVHFKLKVTPTAVNLLYQVVSVKPNTLKSAPKTPKELPSELLAFMRKQPNSTAKVDYATGLMSGSIKGNVKVYKVLIDKLKTMSDIATYTGGNRKGAVTFEDLALGLTLNIYVPVVTSPAITWDYSETLPEAQSRARIDDAKHTKSKITQQPVNLDIECKAALKAFSGKARVNLEESKDGKFYWISVKTTVEEVVAYFKGMGWRAKKEGHLSYSFTKKGGSYIVDCSVDDHRASKGNAYYVVVTAGI